MTMATRPVDSWTGARRLVLQETRSRLAALAGGLAPAEVDDDALLRMADVLEAVAGRIRWVIDVDSNEHLDS